MSEPTLPFDDEDRRAESPAPLLDRPAPLSDRPAALPDENARQYAVDPTRNVVLEASAGTGKTRVLVERYVNLLRAGVEPDHILAITFTRKAAAEMRQRIVDRLKEASRLSEFDAARWRDLKEHLGDIAVSTIDAFCLQLLREFPLEADVDPGFDLADNTEVPRLVSESLDQALRICRAMAPDDDDVALVFAQLGERRVRTGIAALLDRRLVAPHALRRFLQKGPRDLTAVTACESSAARLRELFIGVRGGLDAFLADGPRHHPQFAMLADDVGRLVEDARLKSRATSDSGVVEDARLESRATSDSGVVADARLTSRATSDSRVAHDFSRADRQSQSTFRNLIERLRAYFLTQDGKPRGEKFMGTGFNAEHCDSPDAWKRHRAAAAQIAPAVHDAIKAFRRDLNVVMSRGVWRIFAVAMQRYQHTLESHALLDFSGVLERAVQLLKDMDEFAESRLRLEARHRHVLVDEFQDTSRAQWDLVRQLVKSWGEGFGVADAAIPPSIFIVGDRKQSIYGFRDADVAMVDEAAVFVDALRPDGSPRQAITVSFRSAPGILAFVNEVFTAIIDGDVSGAAARRDAFRYGDHDRFPVAVDEGEPAGGETAPVPAVQFIAGDTVQSAADAVADEIVRLLSGTTVRDRATGVAREAGAADIAILFRSRDSHRDFEAALDRRGVLTYVYKGLGFFEADEIQDSVAVLRYLADPLSDLRAATLLRSRIVRLSDAAVARLGKASADAILSVDPPPALAMLSDEDRRVLTLLRGAVARWLSWVDRLAPSELLDAVLHETAYAFELRGSRRRQARENMKKLRGMIRRAQNRGYATLARIADHLDRLAVGDESNAAIDAIDAVSLMTVHAAKGLEFPIVFVVNMGRGAGGIRAPIRVTDDAAGEASVAIADYQSDADEDVAAKEREESKRLLYVALTRARERLYLSATVKDGVCRMGKGSLGEVLPAAVRAKFAGAAVEQAIDQPPQTIDRAAMTTAWIDDFGSLV